MPMLWCPFCIGITPHFAEVRAGRIACKDCRVDAQIVKIEAKRAVFAEKKAKRRPGMQAMRRLKMNWKKCRERAIEKGIPFNLDLEDCQPPACCSVFGTPFKVGLPWYQRASIDRVKPELGYVKGNIRIISQLANSIKSTANSTQIRAVADWLEKVEQGKA